MEVGTYETATSGYDTKQDLDSMYFSFLGEYLWPKNKNLDIGLGVKYQLPHSVSDYSDAKFNFIPMYGFVRLKMNSPYDWIGIVGQIGYNLLNGNSKFKGDGSLSGGLYAGIGVSMIYEGGTMDFIYSINNGSWKYSSLTVDIKQSIFCWSVIFKL
jgi:hypothetical protein